MLVMCRNWSCIRIINLHQYFIQCELSRLNMGSILPVFLTTLFYWNICFRGQFSAASSCPVDCQCRWKNGKETVECVGRGLLEIPAGIDDGTQVLDLSDNKLQSLAKDTFLKSKLLNLQRIYLARCNIEILHDGAFNRLTNLVELDLSNNFLPAIPTNAFKDIPGLRKLFLNNNPIHRMENYAFSGLASLSVLELSRCQLDSVATKAFHGLKSLTYLKLDNNRLTNVTGKSVQPLKNLHGVDLHGNPWRCDCSMQDVKMWLTKFNIPTKIPALCNQPPRLKGQSLHELQLDDLACQPQSLYSNRRTEVTIGHDATLVCKVTSNPAPAFQWLRHGVQLTNLTRSTKGAQMYAMDERNTGAEKASILTISSVSESDSGTYVCIAENKAGKFTANFTLEVTYRDLEASGLTGGQIAGISLGLIVVGGIVLLLICILLSKWKNLEHRGVHSKHPPLNQSQHKLVNCNNTNHVNYHNKTSHGDGGAGHKVKNSVVNMSFALPRSLSRSSSVARNNFSDEAASDSDRTLVENLTSPSKSSTCNLSNKPDVVNVESRKEKDNNRNKRHHSDSRKNSSKEKRKERRKSKEESLMATSSDEPVDTNNGTNGKKCNTNSHSLQCNSNSCNNGGSENVKTKKRTENEMKIRVDDNADDDDDEGVVVDNRYGSFGNLKLSSSNEWNKATADMIENTGYARDCADGLLQECYELVVQKSAIPPSPHHQHLSSNNKLDNPSSRNDHNNLSSPTATDEIHRTMNISNNEDEDGNAIFKNNSGSVTPANKSANPRFRHYVPVLPPLPAQHYTNVRNSLIRPYFGKEEMTVVEDKTDM